MEKIKAYNLQDQKIYEVSNINYEDNFISLKGFKGELINKGTGFECYTSCQDLEFVEIIRDSHFIDKNKNKIYEGDIIKANKELWNIIFIRGSAALVKENGDFYDYMCNMCDMGGKVYEIVGNKYKANQ